MERRLQPDDALIPRTIHRVSALVGATPRRKPETDSAPQDT